MFKHHSGAFAYTVGVNGVCIAHGLHWLLDFIVAQQKRIRKDRRFREGQRWVHEVRFRRATVFCYPLDSDDDPFTFPQRLYSEVTVPRITLYLEDDVLRTEEERNAEI